MCINYTPPPKQIAESLVRISQSTGDSWPEETFQDYAAPLIRRTRDGTYELMSATYGMLPKAQLAPAAKHVTTMNARAETIGQKTSYANSWRRGQTCLVPMLHFYEPNYESGKAARWAIGMADRAAFCVAGIWRQWDEEEGGQSFSFTQITINADAHPLMRRFHKPGDEKRSLVIVPPEAYEAWLDCRDPELARSMLQLYPAAGMSAWPAAQGYGQPSRNAELF